ncbi:NUDIX domain-containing protein [soil metagenome]
MPQHSAGVLLYRLAPNLQGFLCHMCGPFWERKDAAAWSIPKGLVEPGEDALAAAVREFAEEIGVAPPAVDDAPLIELRLSSGKRVTVFVGHATSALSFVSSNTFELEWPPRSGRVREFAEIDRAEWFDLERARTQLVRGQLPALGALERALATDSR